MEFKEKKPLYKLMELAAILRKECPWDKEQTSITLKPCLIEEAHEVCEAIETNDENNLQEELGDLLYQVYAHSEIAKEQNKFSIDDVANSIIEKLIRRHPHIFGNEKVNNKHEVMQNWEKIKQKERGKNKSILDGVPKTLPALHKAYRIQQKVSRIGFDWEKIDDTLVKLDEEINEFKEALSEKDPAKMKDEAGDVLFSLVNVFRYVDINPEEALSQTIHKFVSRFQYIEKEVSISNKKMNHMSLQELDEIWEKAKRELKK